MKKHFREFIAFIAIFSSLSLFLAAFAFAASDASGQKTFESKCAQCHGKDGKGVAKMVKVLKVDASAIDLTRKDAVDLTDAEITKTVTNGKKKMPKYKGKLTDSQIQDVVKYLRTVQGPGASK